MWFLPEDYLKIKIWKTENSSIYINDKVLEIKNNTVKKINLIDINKFEIIKKEDANEQEEWLITNFYTKKKKNYITLITDWALKEECLTKDPIKYKTYDVEVTQTQNLKIEYEDVNRAYTLVYKFLEIFNELGWSFEIKNENNLKIKDKVDLILILKKKNNIEILINNVMIKNIKIELKEL